MLLGQTNYFVSDSLPYSLHLFQILSFITVVEQIRVPFDDDLLEEILPKVFLN